MILLITVCVVLITIAVIFGRKTAGDVLGCLFKVVIFGIVIGIVLFLIGIAVYD